MLDFIFMASVGNSSPLSFKCSVSGSVLAHNLVSVYNSGSTTNCYQFDKLSATREQYSVAQILYIHNTDKVRIPVTICEECTFILNQFVIFPSFNAMVETKSSTVPFAISSTSECPIIFILRAIPTL